jgi:hypothetical protein
MEIAVWAQTLVLLVTSVFVCWYTIETAKLRREIVRQSQISLRPVVVPIFDDTPGRHVFKLQNVGGACAFNVRVQPIKQVFGEGPTLQVPHETQFVPIDYLPAGQIVELVFSEFSNGKPANEHFLQNKFFPSLVRSPVTITVEFDDVEGGGYEHSITIEPPTRIYESPALQSPADVKNVTLRGIRRRTH